MLVFTYGTLMRGNPANEKYLKTAEFLGEAFLAGYGLYDLGRYPGIVPKEDAAVKGELYQISAELLPALNEYEEEGSLYDLMSDRVVCGGVTYEDVGIYVYRLSVEGMGYLPVESLPWRKK